MNEGMNWWSGRTRQKPLQHLMMRTTWKWEARVKAAMQEEWAIYDQYFGVSQDAEKAVNIYLR